MIFSRSIIVLLSVFLSGFCNSAKNGTEVFPYKIGKTKVATILFSFEGADSLCLLQLHDNEMTAKSVALSELKTSGGGLLSISNKGNRLIKFTYRKKTFQFDPNRIFTAKGRRETLEKNGQYTLAAEGLLEGFAAHLLQLINAPVIISMHNNSNDAYSITSYLSGAALGSDAEQLHINKERDGDDFFLTTDEKIYLRLKEKNFNVVLQNNIGATDDGSLSIYCGKNNKAYVNIEAQHGHDKEQAEMLELLKSILKED